MSKPFSSYKDRTLNMKPKEIVFKGCIPTPRRFSISSYIKSPVWNGDAMNLPVILHQRYFFLPTLEGVSDPGLTVSIPIDR